MPPTYSHPYHMEWNRIVSAQWDPTGMERSLKYMRYKERNLRASLSLSLATDENRLILCSQNGQVRIINRDTAEFNSFYVLFRGFQANILADDSANGILVQVSKVPLLSNNYA